jgi:hypothetical protein
VAVADPGFDEPDLEDAGYVMSKAYCLSIAA